MSNIWEVLNDPGQVRVSQPETYHDSQLNVEKLEESLILTEDLASGDWEYVEETKKLTNYLKSRGVNVIHVYSPVVIVGGVPVDTKLGRYDDDSLPKIVERFGGNDMYVYYARHNLKTRERQVRFA